MSLVGERNRCARIALELSHRLSREQDLQGSVAAKRVYDAIMAPLLPEGETAVFNRGVLEGLTIASVLLDDTRAQHEAAGAAPDAILAALIVALEAERRKRQA